MDRKQIVEIKRGNNGFGLLLENDGYMSLDMPENKILKESIDGFTSGTESELPNPFVVSAVFQKFGIRNANGRVYPERLLKEAVEKYQQAIKERRSFGCLNHPESTDLDLERVCLLITELHWVGHTLVGKMEIPISDGFRKYGICSTLADTLAQWLISGIRVGVSSRGLGGVEKIGDVLQVTEYDLVCWDAVGQPSTPGAYIADEEEKLTPFVENKENQSNDTLVEDKFSKFDKWLND